MHKLFSTDLQESQENMKFQDKDKLGKGYRCFLYDAAVLIAAKIELERNTTLPDYLNIGTGNNQLAIETALNKIRSLFDFFSKGPINDDLSCKNFFDFEIKKLTKIQNEFRKSIHKYAMHITWERVDRNNIKLPRVKQILEICEELEEWIKQFIMHCNGKGLVPNGNGPKYLAFINNNITDTNRLIDRQ